MSDNILPPSDLEQFWIEKQRRLGIEEPQHSQEWEDRYAPIVERATDILPLIDDRRVLAFALRELAQSHRELAQALSRHHHNEQRLLKLLSKLEQQHRRSPSYDRARSGRPWYLPFVRFTAWLDKQLAHLDALDPARLVQRFRAHSD